MLVVFDCPLVALSVLQPTEFQGHDALRKKPLVNIMSYVEIDTLLFCLCCLFLYIVYISCKYPTDLIKKRQE